MRARLRLTAHTGQEAEGVPSPSTGSAISMYAEKLEAPKEGSTFVQSSGLRTKEAVGPNLFYTHPSMSSSSELLFAFAESNLRPIFYRCWPECYLGGTHYCCNQHSLESVKTDKVSKRSTNTDHLLSNMMMKSRTRCPALQSAMLLHVRLNFVVQFTHTDLGQILWLRTSTALC